MRAVEDSNDATFRALRAGNAAWASLDFGENMVTVHGVFDGFAGDEDVAIQLRHRSIGNDKSVAVVMKDQASFNFINLCERGALDLLRMIHTRRLAWCIAIRLAAWQAVTSTRQFLECMAFFEFREHFEQGAGVGLFQVETLGDFACRGRFAPNLQKTQYVIGAEV
jgi:hypothetical protein